MIRTFTVGKGFSMEAVGISSMATMPNEGSVDTTPFRIVPLGTDQASKPTPIPALATGQQYVATVTIPLSRLPGYTANSTPNAPPATPRHPSVTRLQDQITFTASMTVQNLLAGLHILRFTAVPQARSGNQIFNGPNLPVGQEYSSFQVLCNVTFQAEQATTGGVVTISTEGKLTRQAGGAAT